MVTTPEPLTHMRMMPCSRNASISPSKSLICNDGGDGLRDEQAISTPLFLTANRMLCQRT